MLFGPFFALKSHNPLKLGIFLSHAVLQETGEIQRMNIHTHVHEMKTECFLFHADILFFQK